MGKYKVKVTTLMYWIIPIEAKSQKEALEIAKKLHDNDELDSNIGCGFGMDNATFDKTVFKIVNSNDVKNIESQQ